MYHFDRHGTLGAEMRGAIDRTHASLSEELFDLILVIECVHVDSVRQVKCKATRVLSPLVASTVGGSEWSAMITTAP